MIPPTHEPEDLDVQYDHRFGIVYVMVKGVCLFRMTDDEAADLATALLIARTHINNGPEYQIARFGVL